MNEITDLLKCRFPIIQGAMGAISNPEMVAAVSEAGGYGLLATAFLKDTNEFRQQIETARKLTDKPFGANLAALNPRSMDYAQVVAEMGLPAVTTSAGLPQKLVSFFKDKGVKVLHVVASVENALLAQQAGVDAIIAEGMESGGVQGTMGVATMVLIPMVVDAVSVPVVAAGGIGDSRGYRASFALGAKGVQVGTRFIASKECIAHPKAKDVLCRANETETVLLGQDRIRVRAVKTPFVEELIGHPEKQGFADLTARFNEGWIQGKVDVAPLSAGQITGMLQDVKSVRGIIEEMVS